MVFFEYSAPSQIPNPLFSAMKERKEQTVARLVQSIALTIVVFLSVVLVLKGVLGNYYWKEVAFAASVPFVISFFSMKEKRETALQEIAPQFTYSFSAAEKGGLQPVQEGGRFKNHQQDNSPTTHMLETLRDIRKGYGVTPPKHLDNELYQPQTIPGTLSVQWLGHASFLISFKDAFHALIDPNFSDRIKLFGDITLYNRMTPPGRSIESLPPLDTVLISHNHTDHCDPMSLSHLNKKAPLFLTPSGTGERLKREGVITRAQDHTWFDTTTFYVGGKEVKITCVPAHHSSQTSLTNCQKELWCGWVLQFPFKKRPYTLYFMGDTACHMNPSIEGFDSKHQAHDASIFAAIKEKFPKIDLLLLPIDPVKGEENMHLNSEQAVDLIEYLNPRAVIPMHWGTWPFNEFGNKMEGPKLHFQSKTALSSCDSKIFWLAVGRSFAVREN